MSDIVGRLRQAATDFWSHDRIDALKAGANEIERLRAALQPFAYLGAAIDCNAAPHEYTDEDEWSVPMGDLRRAYVAWSGRTGETAENEGSAGNDK